MNLSRFQGFWAPTRKCYRKLGLDIDEINQLNQSELREFLSDELEFITVLMKSGLYIKNDTFKIRFANLNNGKLKTIRKGQIIDVSLNDKGRTELHLLDSHGEYGRLIHKKNKLVDPDTPFGFKRLDGAKA